MKSHDLARLLLENPDMEVATHANNHTNTNDSRLNVGVIKVWGSEMIVIGNYGERNLNDNEKLKENLYTECYGLDFGPKYYKEKT